MSEQLPQPSPLLFLETVNAYQRTAAIKAAVELDVFSAIGEGAQSSSELAARRETSERGMRILCDYLVINGFLSKHDGRYALTPDTAMFLDRRSPAYIGGTLEFMLSPMVTAGFEDLTTAVRQGGTTLPAGGTIAPDNPVWVKFARAMAPMIAMPAQLIAKIVNEGFVDDRELKVLDIAAGHGLFGIAFAQQQPRASVVALDWPQVLEVAKENAQHAGVGERYSTLEGSAFDVDFGEGYDLVLLTNFLHHFDAPTCETLLRKVHASLKAEGRAATLEFVPNDDRVTPPGAAIFSMTMLGSTSHGDAYTFAEFDLMFKNAGFSHSEIHPLPPTPEHLIISHK